MFENPEIAPDKLPTLDAVDWHALDSRYATRLQLQTVIAGMLVLFGLLTLSVLPLPIPRAVLIAGFLFLAFLVAALLGWQVLSVARKRYAIRDRDVLYRTGLIWQSVSAVPFNRVQHVETSSTPLDRRFRLASLHLYTAAGSGGDLKIHGLPVDVAERLRVFVLKRVGEESESD